MSLLLRPEVVLVVAQRWPFFKYEHSYLRFVLQGDTYLVWLELLRKTESVCWHRSCHFFKINDLKREEGEKGTEGTGTFRELSTYFAYPPSKSQPSQNIYTPLPVSTSDH